MKKNKSLLLGVLVTVLAVSLTGVGTAYATTGCFTDTIGHWAETYICWMFENGITGGIGPGVYGPESNVTRAQMSVFLQKIFNLADNSATTKATTAETNAKTYANNLHAGNILVVMGPDDWFQNRNSPSSLIFNRYYNDVEIVNSGTGTGWIIGMPDLPVSMYGYALALTGVEICYQASASVTLVQFDAYVFTESSGNELDWVAAATDATYRNDEACRFYTTTPVTLSGEKFVNIKVHAIWNVAGSPFYLGRATFVLQPIGTLVPPLSKPIMDMEEPFPDISPDKGE